MKGILCQMFCLVKNVNRETAQNCFKFMTTDEHLPRARGCL